MTTTSFRVPAEPIRSLLSSWLKGCETSVLCNAQKKGGNRGLTSMEQLICAIYPDVDTENKTEMKKAGETLRVVLRRRKTIDFDFADMVLCRLDAVELWATDSLLREAYEQMNLKALDQARPVVESAA